MNIGMQEEGGRYMGIGMQEEGGRYMGIGMQEEGGRYMGIRNLSYQQNTKTWTNLIDYTSYHANLCI